MKISWMASPVEKSTGDAIFQNWCAAGETSRLFRDPPPFCFSRPRAPTVSVSSGLLRIKRATWIKSIAQHAKNCSVLKVLALLLSLDGKRFLFPDQKSDVHPSENLDGTTKYIDVGFVNKTMRGFNFILFLYGSLYKLKNIVWLSM